MEGFVAMIPRRGAYIADISIRDIAEIYEIRTSLNILAAGLAAERIMDEEIEELNRLLMEIKGYVKKGNMEKIVEADTAFHDVLYQASRNVRLRNTISNLREQLTGMRGRSLSQPGRLANTTEEHRILVDCITARDVEGAQEAARIHIENAQQTLMKSLSNDKV